MRWKNPPHLFLTQIMKHLIYLSTIIFSIFVSSCSKSTFVAVKGTGKIIRLALKDNRLTKKEIITYNYDKHSFILLPDRIMLPCLIDGHGDTLFFDTGYNGSLHEYIDSPDKFPMKPILTQSTIAFSKTIWEKKSISVHTVESPWVTIQNHVCMVSCNNFQTMEYCNKKSKRGYKMVGLQMLPSYFQTLCLNFSDTTIQLTDSNSLYDTIGYHRVPALFSSRDGTQYYKIPRITLQIDSLDVDFLFDTGAGLCLAANNYNAHTKSNDIKVIGELGRDASGTVYDTIHLQTSSIHTFGNATDTVLICYFSHLTENVMGLDFISGYDWIIDYHRNRVYAKQVTTKNYNITEIPLYGVSTHNDSTLVITRTPFPEKNGYSLGSIINAVNGERVCSENICNLKALLNHTKDWKSLKITIVSHDDK